MEPSLERTSSVDVTAEVYHIYHRIPHLRVPTLQHRKDRRWQRHNFSHSLHERVHRQSVGEYSIAKWTEVDWLSPTAADVERFTRNCGSIRVGCVLCALGGAHGVAAPPLCFFFFLMIRRPPRSTLFPSATLFR